MLIKERRMEIQRMQEKKMDAFYLSYVLWSWQNIRSTNTSLSSDPLTSSKDELHYHKTHISKW